MAHLSLKSIYKTYSNGFEAVKNFNIEIQDKEFIVFVGPSGCGKSTVLRMIAGLEDITSGELYIGDKLCNDIEPKNRNIAMVFQNYALYPHMNVKENIAFALKLRKMPKSEINKRVDEVAKLLDIESLLERKPKALSGGQRQRVALGRAIVRNAQVYLMDEPLSNLDAKLRIQMRSEIIKLHERVNATMIYVTHDQTEAMTMADRIVVMKDGNIQQIGTPKDIYHQPANMFVASFLGSFATNFLQGMIKDNCFCCENHQIQLPEMFHEKLKSYHDKEIILGIRPEDLHSEDIVADTYPTSCFDFEIEVSELLGHEFILHGNLGQQPLEAKIAARQDIKAHQKIKLAMDLAKVHFYDPQSQINII